VIAPPAPPPAAVAPRPGPSPLQQGLLLGLALAPLGLAAFLWLVAPGFLDPFWDRRVALAGVPLGFWLIGMFVAMTALAVLIALRVRSVILAGVAVVLLAGMALYLVILGPAMVLIVIGLGST
jgi:hypothetical protein